MKNSAPYGTWKSSITSTLLTAAGIGLSQVEVAESAVFWAEGRPLESGRTVVVRQGPDGTAHDVTPEGFNVRTRAHEYGGGAYTCHNDQIFFCNFVDQRVYRQSENSPPEPVTPVPPSPGSLRYADMQVSPDGRTIVSVRERHEGSEPENDVVIFPADGSTEPRILTAGHDFYSSLRFSPDGRQLAWLTWDHPNMPWDGTELWLADFDATAGLSQIRRVAGGANESIFQPEWSPSGILHFISDRTGWWNLYAFRGDEIVPRLPMTAEFGIPQWIFGMSRYVFLQDGRIACIYSRNGSDFLAILDQRDPILVPVEVPYSSLSDLQACGKATLVLVAASPTLAAQVIEVDIDSGSIRVLKASMNVVLEPQDLSVPESIEFPTTGKRTAHALFYAPCNALFTAPPGEKPPLLVISHGGPTSAATSALRLSTQYWTSRGFAVVDVDYGGSSGYGREYRERLNGAWGIVDVDDCIHAAEYLAARGSVDARRMAIRGHSAGGYTTLCALAFHNVFAAGASYFGVADLTALATDTHKFESRYLDRLIGPYPAAAEIYRERSPIHFADRLACPVILLQGLEDKVVPPNQAETFIAALRKKDLPCEYVVFPTEGHGFRQAENIQRAAEAELEFYWKVFGLERAEEA